VTDLCGKIKNFRLASCILVMNSSSASNIASVAFVGVAGNGSLIDAQKINGRSGVRRSWVTIVLENDGGRKKEWPGPKDISPSLGSSSSSCSSTNLSRCFPSSLLSSVSIWFELFDLGELFIDTTSWDYSLYLSSSRFPCTAAAVASNDIV